jgi:plasmid replication initiation protein
LGYGTKKIILMETVMATGKKGLLVVQHNNLIESRYSLTALEQRFILSLVSKIDKDDEEFCDYETTLSELSELMGINITNMYFEIGKLADRLMSRVMTIKTSHGWKKLQWLSYCEYNSEKAVVVCSFHPKLKPFLLRLKQQFTLYSLNVVTQFQSIYSIRIYQLLKQYKKIGWREFKLDELKKILGLKKTQYSAFKDFRRWVLNQAKKEFEKKDKAGNCKCDLTFMLETIREGRKIARLKFIIVEQKYQASAFVPDIVKKEPKPKKPQTVQEQLVYYGISEKLAVGFLNQIGEADILDILKYYSDLLQSGKVKSTGGAYLAKLLREGITVKSSYEKNKEAEEELKKKQREFEQKQKELERQQQELSQKKAEEDQRNKNLKLKEQFDSLPGSEQEKLLLEFEATLDRFMLDYYRENGVESVVVRCTFFNFLDGKLY